MAEMFKAEDVKNLRERTGAGMMDCKNALTEANGSVEKAIDILRKRGIAIAQKKSGRTTKEGRVASYIDLGGKIGVLLEVNCETDFVAKNEDFNSFCQNITLQIAAANPQYLSPADVPAAYIEKEKEIYCAQIKDKPANVLEKIVQGKVDKRMEEICLLEQKYIKDDTVKVKDYLTSVIARIGENIIIRRFVRFELGEEIIK
jgi:elongation factor Ts